MQYERTTGILAAFQQEAPPWPPASSIAPCLCSNDFLRFPLTPSFLGIARRRVYVMKRQRKKKMEARMIRGDCNVGFRPAEGV